MLCGPRALKPLLIGVTVGLPLGLILHYKMPNFLYSEVIALAAATWTVAFLSMWAAKIFGKPTNHNFSESPNSYHAYSWPGQEQFWSNLELKALYSQVVGFSKTKHRCINPHSAAGHHLSYILAKYGDTKLDDLAERAFPAADSLLALSCRLFREGILRVDIAPMEIFTTYDSIIRAVSCTTGENEVRLCVGQNLRYISDGQSLETGSYQG